MKLDRLDGSRLSSSRSQNKIWYSMDEFSVASQVQPSRSSATATHARTFTGNQAILPSEHNCGSPVPHLPTIVILRCSRGIIFHWTAQRAVSQCSFQLFPCSLLRDVISPFTTVSIQRHKLVKLISCVT